MNRWLTFLIVAMTSAVLWAQQRPPQGPRLPDDVKALRDVPYVKADADKAQVLDLFVPKSDKPLPLIVWIHGGAWRGGSKAQCAALPFLAKGYAVASVEYRMSQVATFPAQIHDCKAAIRWLRANAKQHNIDPERIGVWGSSAGGHLVALLGVTAGDKELDGSLGEHAAVSTRIKCVVDWFGPTNLSTMGSGGKIDHDSPNAPEALLIGGAVPQNRDKAAKASPVTYVTQDDAPILIMHGDKDDVVPKTQSDEFHAALKKAGVDVTYKVVEGAGHGFRDRSVIQAVEEFFRAKL